MVIFVAMDNIVRLSEATVSPVSTQFIRPLYETIHWDNSLNALLGARGVGKTTLLLQRMKLLNLPPNEALYIDLGDLYFQENRLFEFAEQFIEQGGKYLFVDEVHRYGRDTWAQELKQLYDIYRGKLKITFTGSSAIRILEQNADLSRRALQYRIPGLSFREYLTMSSTFNLSILNYKDILDRHQQIVGDLLVDAEFRPLAEFPNYLRHGHYPFFLTEPEGFNRRLSLIIQLVLESDIPMVMKSGFADFRQLSRLLYAVASSVPFKPNITKLSARLGISREVLLRYLRLLESADLIANLQNESKGVGSLTKPDKIYLNNTNLLYALAPNQVEIGTVRETFFLNQLDYLTYEAHIIPPEIRLPKAGDFTLLDKDNRYVFEVGGPNKSSKQIGTSPNHFVITDTERTGNKHRIPLWLFGLLY